MHGGDGGRTASREGQRGLTSESLTIWVGLQAVRIHNHAPIPWSFTDNAKHRLQRHPFSVFARANSREVFLLGIVHFAIGCKALFAPQAILCRFPVTIPFTF